MELPIALLRDAGAVLAKPSRRRWFWGGATLLALLASVGVVSATGAERTDESIAVPMVGTPVAEPVEVVRAPGWPTVGDGPCRLSVRALPANSIIHLDGVPQTKLSPVTLATTCGEHRVDVENPSYATATVWGTLVADQAQTIDLTLSLRIDAISVRTKPAGGMIYIGGKLVGRAPRRVDVLGNTPVTIEIRKPGYRTVVTQVTTTSPHTSMSVQLKAQAFPKVVRRRR